MSTKSRQFKHLFAQCLSIIRDECKHELLLNTMADKYTVVIRFKDQATEERALTFLRRKYDFMLWRDGNCMVQKQTLAALDKAELPYAVVATVDKTKPPHGPSDQTN